MFAFGIFLLGLLSRLTPIFRHKAHIGWDQDGGFSQQMFDAEPMDDSVRALLTAAGQNPDKMKPDDIKFVYKFLESWDANESKPTPKYTSSSQYPTPPSTETTRIPVASYESRSNRPLPSVSSQTGVQVIIWVDFSCLRIIFHLLLQFPDMNKLQLDHHHLLHLHRFLLKLLLLFQAIDLRRWQ